MIKSFMEMPVWEKANELSVRVFHLTKDLPRAEDYGLTSQIRRASNSVSANIAEGFGRKTSKDKANFYTMALGSVYETQSHLIYGNQTGYFTTADTKHIINEYNQIIHDLNKIILSLR
jgi:four helix bundle protein